MNKTMKETEKIAKDRVQPNQNTLPTEEELELRFATAYSEGMDTLKTLIKNILDSQNKGVSLNVKTPKKRIAV